MSDDAWVDVYVATLLAQLEREQRRRRISEPPPALPWCGRDPHYLPED